MFFISVCCAGLLRAATTKKVFYGDVAMSISVVIKVCQRGYESEDEEAHGAKCIGAALLLTLQTFDIKRLLRDHHPNPKHKYHAYGRVIHTALRKFPQIRGHSIGISESVDT